MVYLPFKHEGAPQPTPASLEDEALLSQEPIIPQVSEPSPPLDQPPQMPIKVAVSKKKKGKPAKKASENVPMESSDEEEVEESVSRGGSGLASKSQKLTESFGEYERVEAPEESNLDLTEIKLALGEIEADEADREEREKEEEDHSGEKGKKSEGFLGHLSSGFIASIAREFAANLSTFQTSGAAQFQKRSISKDGAPAPKEVEASLSPEPQKMERRSEKNPESMLELPLVFSEFFTELFRESWGAGGSTISKNEHKFQAKRIALRFLAIYPPCILKFQRFNTGLKRALQSGMERPYNTLQDICLAQMDEPRAFVEMNTSGGRTPAVFMHSLMLRLVCENKPAEALESQALPPMLDRPFGDPTILVSHGEASYLAAWRVFLSIKNDMNLNDPRFLNDRQRQLEIDSNFTLSRGEDGSTQLHTAAMSGDKDTCAIVNSLAKAGAARGGCIPQQPPLPGDVSPPIGHDVGVSSIALQGLVNKKKHTTGYTPLHEAVRMGAVEVVEWLVQQKASIDTVSANGSTPLLIAAREDQFQVCTKLLDLGADIEDGGWVRRGGGVGWRAREGRLCYQGVAPTPLWACVHNGSAEMVEWLIERGASPSAFTHESEGCRTMLMDACAPPHCHPLELMDKERPEIGEDRLRIIQILLDSGANLEAETVESKDLRGAVIQEGGLTWSDYMDAFYAPLEKEVQPAIAVWKRKVRRLIEDFKKKRPKSHRIYAPYKAFDFQENAIRHKIMTDITARIAG